MQDDKVLKWLLDIRSAIVEIESFLSENQQGFSGLQQRSMFKRALERNIEIIGEAVNRILLVEPNVAIIPGGKWFAKIAGCEHYCRRDCESRRQ
ncbi:MAG: hypothetical protein IPM81_03180 [Saprospirales bacterium]|nr:hypothetical protein [Saprospirales bacterium]